MPTPIPQSQTQRRTPQPAVRHIETSRRTRGASSFSWRSLGASILVVLLILGGAIAAAYYLLSQAVITVIPRQQTVTTEFPLTIGQTTIIQEGLTQQIAGQAFDQQLERTRSINQVDQQEVESRASGIITLHNERSTAISLVKDTQLIPEGRDTVFRIQQNVTVPANGTLEVDVLSDIEGDIGNVQPTRWEIVKLVDSLKEQVYATSSQPMQGGITFSEVLTQDQIDAVREDVTEELRLSALEEIRSSHPDLTFPEDGIVIEPGDTEVTASPGETVESFEVTARIRLVAFAFQESAVLDAALEQLTRSVPDAYELLGVDDASFSYTVDAYDISAGTARLTVALSGTAVAAIDSSTFDPSVLIGRDALETANYFEQFDTVEGVDVYFAPFWTTKVPPLPSHIEVVIERPEPPTPTRTDTSLSDTISTNEGSATSDAFTDDPTDELLNSPEDSSIPSTAPEETLLTPIGEEDTSSQENTQE